ncbi:MULTISPECIES: XylR family transcriptional regulator [Pasteurellaceae]|uniref:DNA-binding transcriptional regulator n=1 Tax=Pasteurella atlantica TaxID=2827233 RepID=A0AAW8CNS9_9PAST|nr:DNA-binding transcriptional regulator [Pasteurella atlantica]MBR0573146.1 DNA-binding transcriptional regulator [Pasteurella atlantica]MDP8038997.1 DNA-binding transcriptional regulator [Pasteurella atlantica]MDP8041087.1 DNA-binding transcriptional regulator [Pasteurella atlantica]MDP8043300.1 DNA-binding transcriptional regulator [Pasteurella atlantica]MDP8045386.1 DNA-binding transcriptional regulator [Pasteurella atlantica]
MKEQKTYCITLLFNANKVYDRQIIEGVGQYLQASQCNWNIFIEDNFIYQKDILEDISIDGIIADFDDSETANKLLKFNQIPTIAVGSSYKDPSLYPDIPYVATDNNDLVEAAFLHLRQKGISNFAFYGMIPPKNGKHWSIERQNTFVELMNKYKYPNNIIYQGENITSKNWLFAQQNLQEWIKTLPAHTGIIAVTDARARHLLQACEYLNIAVPDQLCIIGIDNEELIQHLSRVSLSSVMQGTRQIGYQAAKLLDNLLNNKPISKKPILIPSIKVVERRSTDYRSLKDPFVIQAMHFIRHNACKRIKVEQVLDHLRISRSNLENRFKIDMKKTIHQAIYDEKLKRAIDLLCFTNMSIQEITEICGYPSVQYFYFIFKKEYKKTPKEFKNMMLN